MIVNKRIEFRTEGNGQIQDITRQVTHQVQDSGLRNGIVVLFTPSSTSALTTIEFEPGAVHDLQQLFERIAPVGIEYQHNLRWGDGNGYAHIRHALMGPSLSIPLVEGQMTLGTWQQIVYIDFDNRARSRSVVLQVVGE